TLILLFLIILKKKTNNFLWWGVLADCGTVWRHGCRHRAYMDVLAACPASGEDTAPSTNQAFDCIQ
ncbi:hypothetical protein R4K57_01270, partial [Xanthomonas hortorum pv. vitians]|nr:hypothetical protein [Xanthomonas hortorum pv. vitians]